MRYCIKVNQKLRPHILMESYKQWELHTHAHSAKTSCLLFTHTSVTPQSHLLFGCYSSAMPLLRLCFCLCCRWVLTACVKGQMACWNQAVKISHKKYTFMQVSHFVSLQTSNARVSHETQRKHEFSSSITTLHRDLFCKANASTWPLASYVLCCSCCCCVHRSASYCTPGGCYCQDGGGLGEQTSGSVVTKPPSLSSSRACERSDIDAGESPECGWLWKEKLKEWLKEDEGNPDTRFPFPLFHVTMFFSMRN